MKKNIYMLLLMLLGLSSCEYDNYDAPSVTFSGQLLYNGSPFLHDGNPARNIFAFFQEGFGKIDPGTGMFTREDGTFQQLLFPGEYKLTLVNKALPFEIEELPIQAVGYDSIAYDLRKDTKVDFHVTPYYEISNLEAGMDGIDIKATFHVKRVEGTRLPAPRVVKAKIYLGTNRLVNSICPVVAETPVNISEEGNVTISISAINYRNGYQENFREYAFYRVALELENVPDYYLFSDIKKVEGIPEEFNDVTNEHMKNYRQPFEVVSYFPDARRGVLADWIASNDAVQYTMYDGWADRLFMCAENWGGPGLKGSIYQTFTLPAGKYVLIATRGWNKEVVGADEAYFAVAKGKGIEWNSADILVKGDCFLPEHQNTIPLALTLEQNTEVSVGYVVNFVAGEFNALSFTAFTIYKT